MQQTRFGPIYLKSEQFAKTGSARQRPEFDKGDATPRPARGRRIARRLVNERLRGKLVELPTCRCGSPGPRVPAAEAIRQKRTAAGDASARSDWNVARAGQIGGESHYR